MELSSAQLTALQSAQSILHDAGLSPRDLDDHSQASSPSPSSYSSPDSPTTPLPLSDPDSCSAILAAQYIPPPARSFTPAEISAGAHRINRQSIAHAIINHPPGIIVEYPQTGSSKGNAIAHIFTLARDSNTADFNPAPQSNFQYSLGDGHGGLKGVQCHLLRDSAGQPVRCKKLSTSCKGLKTCSARSEKIFNATHSYTNRSHVAELIAPPLLPFEDSAKREVFLKTFAFFCSLVEHGCAFMASPECVGMDRDDADSDDVSMTSTVMDDEEGTTRHLSSASSTCQGKLVMRVDRFNRRYIQCQFRSQNNRSHLILGNLQEFDTRYLQALLDDDEVLIASHEEDARQDGYGPLIPCRFVASPSEQKQLSHWHRFSDGTLARGTLLKWEHHCTAKFDIYVPEDLPACPQVVVICHNPHSHPPPAPVKTPPSLVNLFLSLLLDMDWQLADATPRRIVLDSGFMKGLRMALGWVADRSPCLSDIHPSLANLDHVRHLINVFRFEKYPLGTGFEGARLLVDEENKQPREQRYVRCAETYTLTAKTEFRLVICMTTSMAQRLLGAKRISIDTSFKRLHGWQEFEIEAWDSEHMRSVTGARAFTTSQSAQAHLILFQRIFQIAEEDTGLSVSFYHIHGTGYESVVADGHMGQGLGLGMFCVELCQNNHAFCSYEQNRRLRDLDPYDHLRRFYRVCITHFKRNVLALRTYVSSEVYSAMLSLASTEAQPDIETTFKTIRAGGRKAQAWLKDKLVTNKFVLAAIYRPASLIPEIIWRACPSTTNGNEQAHRSANRDGVNLTLLGGIMRGRDFDERAAQSMGVHMSLGINTRDQDATHVCRATRSIVRQGNIY
ncbi:hypothetical protein DEU56DRAFT_748432 [Suillus clintonianus]|uniref:uncharacterized protein n=1 Tax=Suillus clintonianus TaxID=1904413 RepID=UPI001B866452|nr:uncharacterized protein DEU56DRAFT_748432 [Suillus clintonianus]KAG2116152.1 hypothetical protein DEU56DRAFT_748432 [Suillus clintonianus]